ncbi:MAG: DUF3794 domain-containing protein [Oscillospiraceae bacterium]|jgi:hypothetical protein|nr:DUF3794 domain-containing protein [Oscillospiraceae bacterium]
MEYHINQERLTLGEAVLDESKEQPVDVDFSLPDYCPDIQRILKCSVIPKINSRNILADRLEIEGVATVSILYMDASNNVVRSCEHSMPFSCSFNVSKEEPNSIVFTLAKIEYVNCRAVNSRRLDIHGAFSIHARVYSKKQREVVGDIDGDSIQQKKITAKVSDISGTGFSQFLVEEVVELGASYPLAKDILRTDVIVMLSDYKVTPDKVIVNGDAVLRVLYVVDFDTGELQNAEYTIPISQVVDVVGATSESVCDVKLDVLGFEVSDRNDAAEGTILDVNLNLCATAIAYDDKEIDIISDAYSTSYELKPAYEQINFSKFHSKINENYSDKISIELKDKNVLKVLDMWNEMLVVKSQKEKDKILFVGKMNVCILAVDLEENIFYTERIVDFEYEKNFNENIENIFAEVEAKIISLAYRIVNENKIEVRFEIKFSAFVSENKSYKNIVDIFIDEEKPKEKDSAALTIYYADAGDSIWDIACRHNTSIEDIKIQNDLQDDILAVDTMLLIPIS